jgi:gamma-glutamylcyclotransferase (GGCT)/AIG2-like uncharacterized protein YtfP
MLHFAYGSNMSREPMRRRCPGARMLGRAMLRKYRFVIMANGYASVVPAPSDDVHGVLWRITPRDLAALDAYENIAGGLYRRVMAPVTHHAATVTAMTYLGCEKREGHPRKGYLELVIESAREAGLPAEYIEGLARYSGGRFLLNASSGTGDRT